MNKKESHTVYDKIFRYAESLGYGEIHIKFDHATGLRAIIALHSTKLGPAIGGCRFYSYDTADDAIIDALRLGQMMSLKAAIHNLPHGGGKAVLIKPAEMKNRTAYFEAFGQFVNELNGRYVTAVDVGTDPNDMDIIGNKTSYVTCTTYGGYAGDPSPLTALGVRRGIEAAVKFKLGRDDLSDLHIAIQGVGHVGYYLAKEVVALGAHVTVTDVNAKALERCRNEFGANVVEPDAIYSVPCDVFAPCALGAILNLENIKKLNTSIVAGSANNQLDHLRDGYALHERGILYAPDFVINSGGLIHVAAIYDHGDQKKAYEKIQELYNTTLDLFEQAKIENLPTSEVAEIIACRKLGVKR